MEDEGHVIPELVDRPEIFQDAIPYFAAFRELSTSRPMGFGVGFIPHSEIHSYLNEHQIYSYEERDEYFNWIQFIDRLYVTHSNKKQ